MPITDNFFNNLRKLRGDDKSWVTRIAEKARLSRATVNQFVNGQGDPALSSIEKLAAALAVPVSDLLGNEVPTIIETEPTIQELRLEAIRLILAADWDDIRTAIVGLNRPSSVSSKKSTAG